jgi:hypothetical protein
MHSFQHADAKTSSKWGEKQPPFDNGRDASEGEDDGGDKPTAYVDDGCFWRESSSPLPLDAAEHLFWTNPMAGGESAETTADGSAPFLTSESTLWCNGSERRSSQESSAARVTARSMGEQVFGEPEMLLLHNRADGWR